VSFLTPEILKGTDWRAVERAVARVMSHCGWQSVQLIGGSGDAGGDIVGVREIDGRKVVFVVQVKCVMGASYIGIPAVQEAVDAMGQYSANIAVVATNGDFTASAKARQKELVKAGFDVRLWNGKFLQDLLSKWPETHHERQELRPYQSKIVVDCLKAFELGKPRAFFIVATGLGKTVIAAEVLSTLLAQGKVKRALVLCHTQDLALQLEQSFWRLLPKSVPTRVFFDGAPPKLYDGVNFGLYQTLSNYLSGIEPGDYGVVIVDEAHHALAPAFKKCLDHLKPHHLLGMTATPWRGDASPLEEVFGPPLGSVSLVDGMSQGYLAQVDYRIYCDTIKWDEMSSITKGEMTIRDLNKRLFIPQRDDAVIAELKRHTEQIPEPRMIIFCASIEHCNRFAALLNSSTHLICKPISGLDRVERYKTLMEFASGKIHAVTAVDVLNEGIDVPDTNVLVFLRSTHSRRIFIQQLGRGLRLAPGKESLLVLDFVTDIRRLAEVMDFEKEIRDSKKKYREVYLKDRVIAFNNEAALPFIEQWIKDVADLGEADDSHKLKFPEPV